MRTKRRPRRWPCWPCRATGYTPESTGADGYRKAAARGLGGPAQALQPDGRFYGDVSSSHQLYTQAQCTIAICELYGMTRNDDLSRAGAAGRRLLRPVQSAAGRLAISAGRRQRYVGHRLDGDGAAKRADGRPRSAQPDVRTDQEVFGRGRPRRRQPLRLSTSRRARRCR